VVGLIRGVADGLPSTSGTPSSSAEVIATARNNAAVSFTAVLKRRSFVVGLNRMLVEVKKTSAASSLEMNSSLKRNSS
jgi:hypothetical protein